jgi:hypothetical protein
VLIRQQYWTEIPMPHELIDMGILACRAVADLTFAERKGTVISVPDDD